jgi:hypothetical protein
VLLYSKNCLIFLAIPRDLIDIVLRSPVITMLPLEREGEK